jgi:hypothetical protein
VDTYLKTLQDELASAIAGLSWDRLDWHPPGKWSGAQVLEHLYLSYTGSTKGFSRVLAAEKATSTPITWTQRRNIVIALGLGYLGSGREAPSSLRPRGLPIEKITGEIAQKIAELDDMIATCEKKLGRGPLMDHPFLGPLTGRQWRKFHLVHGRHHVKQIRKLKDGKSMG